MGNSELRGKRQLKRGHYLQHLAEGTASDIREHSWNATLKFCNYKKVNVCINHEAEIYRNQIFLLQLFFLF